ncbi:heterodisulfide reductase subunit B [Humidesulfovibrio mexicanus]|uniref:Heterodisulfide reductase subunit B n=1 Tax=Humidesulfovibrio mexicanus TaxID=147047 RepID=A0A239CW64_9BACT|nr:CoB--CoM heterodisulfide reductase iron-sulfur subunit B family protein [Humidesulfovibrio mexicanus]SNS24149.1 heterodisulfide reductase subunit B [Humidesulfovibrio mexicanus]
MSARLGYYPGCSQSGTAAENDISSRACLAALGIGMSDVPDWTCCGSTPAHTVDHHLAGALAARNLLQAEAAGFGCIATPCPSCLAALKTADAHLAEPAYKAAVERLLGRAAPGPMESKSVLQVLMEQAGPQGVKARVTRPLTGLKVACYYGCLLNRPPGLMAFDDPENPTAMDELMAACGATVVDYPFKTECCGAAFAMPRLDVMRRLTARLLDMAAECGADAIAVACPLCQMNLDLRRGQANTAARAPHAMPVPYFTQLMGLALGLPEADLALSKLVLPLAPALDAATARQAEAAKNGKEDAPCA